MADRLTGVARHLRGLLAPAVAPTDADLLGRFADRLDEEAFAELVRRHGPLVWGVCRRILRNTHDADDAFQATFLILARRAAAVRRAGHAPAGWLHGVAYRTALEARRSAAIRRAKERRAAQMRAHEPPPPEAPDLRAVLDHELALLPEAYRAAVALCDLEGLPRAEAARRLGWSAGTLSGRLARARAILAKRLARRGLAAALGAAAVQTGTVTAELVESTARVGVLVAAGGAAATVAPAPVAALTEGVLKAMFLTKLKGMAAGLMVACAVLVTGAAGWDSATAGPQEPARGGTAKKAQPNPDKERMAQLEKERAELLKKLADLQARVDALEKAQQKPPVVTGGTLSLNPTLGLQGTLTQGTTLTPTYSNPGVTTLQGTLTPSTSGVTGSGTLRTTSNPTLSTTGGPSLSTARTATGTAPAQGGATVQVYPLGELVSGDPQAEGVIRILQATVEPTSWRSVGGAGVIEYFAPKKVLVVRQSPEVHKQIAELLELLRVKTGDQ